MTIRIVRLGTPRAKGEGLRIGTVRRPPRGVPKTQFAELDFYDVWLPNLAPSQELVTFAQHSLDQKSWPVSWTRPVGSATKRLPDQRISTVTRSHCGSPVTARVWTQPTAHSAMKFRGWPGGGRRRFV